MLSNAAAIPRERDFPPLSPSQRAANLFLGNYEPGLGEMIGDDIVRRVMERDGVGPQELRVLMDTMRERLGPRLSPGA